MSCVELFYENPFCRSFTARVTNCRPAGDSWEITLDQTAFFPEGGGQPGDRGELQAGDTTVQVTDTQLDGDAIWHRCDAPLQPGQAVQGNLDWGFRFDLMQQHSGEHLVSGVVHRRYGYDNVGFHMGSDVITVDFNGELTWQQLLEIEQEANEWVWQDVPTHVFFPGAKALQLLDYRSKKELTGRVRLVEFPGADLCACCGIHVSRTGQIGLIKILSVVKFRSGVRIELVCGDRALAAVNAQMHQNHLISNLLSAKADRTAEAVERLQQELERRKFEANALRSRIAEAAAEQLAGSGNVLLFEDDLSGDALRRYCTTVGERCGGRCAVFSPTADGSFQYAIRDEAGNLRELAGELNAALHGRGGGKPQFIQGSVQASQADIEAFFATR